MKGFGMNRVRGMSWALLLVSSLAHAQTNDLPHFQEVLRLLRANLPGVTDDDLDRAAAQGLLDGFRPRVLLVTNPPAAPALPPLVSRTRVHDRAFGYVRLAEIAAGLPDRFTEAWDELCGTNRLKGLVLDLRFTTGDDYRAAAGVADRFLTNEQPLIRWGDESAQSTEKTNALELPLVVLVNHETAGAAEALAEALRTTRAGLVVGSRTAGRAYVFKEFELANGQRLLVASTPVQVGPDQALTEGVAPDIDVAVSAHDEKAWFADPFRGLSDSPALEGEPETGSTPSTNRLRPRLNEAELVRRQRDRAVSSSSEGLGAGPSAGPRSAEPAVRDPALARALDLLRALALVSRSRPS